MGDDRRFYEAAENGARRSAPAALRNRDPIAEVLRDWLPEKGLVLEVASGTGEHAVHFAKAFPHLDWQPSDTHSDAISSVAAWRRESGLDNLLEPIAIDASSSDWPIEQADAVLNINMAHISPWAASLGLIVGAARILRRGGSLIYYGPWLKDDIDTAASNLAFDADLKRRDPQWGLRRVEDLAAAAGEQGFALCDYRPMPAHNLMLLFRLTEDRGT
jgi:SAM-dependent methyltransferase